jgi:hypothetical protein
MSNSPKADVQLVERVEDERANPDPAAIEIDIGSGDKALQYLKQVGDNIAVSAEESRLVLRKIDRRVLPFMLFAYILQQVCSLSTINDLF